MNRAIRYGVIGFSVSIFIYIIYRAITLSFTHDEALTYLIIKGDEGLKDTANHHILNTYLMQLCSIFSEQEWCLRLPNVLGGALFIWFVLKLIKPFDPLFQLFYFFPLLLLNNYLLDFFSLARGYGISLACLMGSVYFFLKTNPTFADKILCLLFAALGVWANFNLINFFIGIAGLQVLYALKSGPSKERQFWIQISLLITFSALVVILSMMRLMELKNNGQLYYGIDTLSGAFDSIVVWSLDLSKLPDNFLVFFRYAMASILVFSCAYFIWKKQLNSASAKMWVLIMAITIGLIAEHQFFAALYPQNRTALFIIPLLVLQIGHLINELVPKSTRQALISGFLLAALVAYPLTNQFLSRINGEGVGEWYYDASTKEAALRIYDETGGERVIVACNWMFKPAMQYYIQTRNLNFETIQSDHSEATEAKILYDFFSEEQNEKFNKSKTWLMNGGLTAVYFR